MGTNFSVCCLSSLPPPFCTGLVLFIENRIARHTENDKHLMYGNRKILGCAKVKKRNPLIGGFPLFSSLFLHYKKGNIFIFQIFHLEYRSHHVVGKSVQFLVKEVKFSPLQEYHIWAGEYLNFVSMEEPECRKNDHVGSLWLTHTSFLAFTWSITKTWWFCKTWEAEMGHPPLLILILKEEKMNTLSWTKKRVYFL